MTRHKPCDIQNRWSTMFCFLSWYICHAICYLYKKLTHVFAWAQIYYLRPYLGTEIILCHLSLQMAWMDKVWNLKKLGQLFHVFRLCLQKSPKYFMVSAPWWNLIDIFVITLQEHFVYGALKMTSAQRWGQCPRVISPLKYVTWW